MSRLKVNVNRAGSDSLDIEFFPSMKNEVCAMITCIAGPGLDPQSLLDLCQNNDYTYMAEYLISGWEVPSNGL